MQINNAESDAERNVRLNIRNGIAVVGERSRNNIVEGKTEDAGSLAETVATLTVEEDEPEDSAKSNAEGTEHMKLYEETIAFLTLLGKLFGMDFIFNWRWERKVMYWFTLLVLLCSYVCIGYTVFIHIHNDELVRVLEPLASMGLAISVSQNFNNIGRLFINFIFPKELRKAIY